MSLIRVVTTFTGNITGGGINSSYFDVVTNVPTTGSQAAIDAMRDFWTTCNSIIGVGCSWVVSGSVQHIEVATGNVLEEFSLVSRSGAGTATGDTLPFQVQGLARLRTPVFISGRRVRGHWNIPSPTESFNGSSGVPTGGYTTALAGALNTLVAHTDPALTIYSRAHRQIAGPVTGTAPAVWATLRSRRD